MSRKKSRNECFTNLERLDGYCLLLNCSNYKFKHCETDIMTPFAAQVIATICFANWAVEITACDSIRPISILRFHISCNCHTAVTHVKRPPCRQVIVQTKRQFRWVFGQSSLWRSDCSKVSQFQSSSVWSSFLNRHRSLISAVHLKIDTIQVWDCVPFPLVPMGFKKGRYQHM